MASTAGRVQVIGFADNVRDLMAAADVIVTKAGAVTLAEALAAELPMVCFGSLTGHEARNEGFLVRAGAALAARSSDGLAGVLASLLTDPRPLSSMRDRMRDLRRPEAARHVVQLVLGAGRLARERAS